MPVNMSTMVYLPCQELFGRPVTFTSALGNSYSGPGRGIFDTRPLDVVLEDQNIMSDQDTILDIRKAEYSVLPVQGDMVNIPYEPESGLPAWGDFIISDLDDNGGGELTLTLKKVV